MRQVRTVLLAALAALAAGAPPGARGAGASAFERLDNLKLARALKELDMQELLSALVGRDGRSIEAKVLLAETSRRAAAKTQDQAERDRLLDEAIEAYAELAEMTKDATGFEGRLQHFTFRLEKIVLAGTVKVESYVERIQYFCEGIDDAETVRRITKPAVRELDALVAELQDVHDKWARDDRAVILGWLDKLERLIGRVRYRGAWARYYRGIVLPPDDTGRKMLLQRTMEDVFEFCRDPDNSSGVKYQSLQLSGKAARELGEFDNARALLKQADSASASSTVRLNAMFEYARSFIDQERFAEADQEIEKFRQQAPKLAGVQPVAVDLQWTLLRYRRLMVEAAKLRQSDPARAGKQEDEAFGLVTKLLEKYPRFQAPLLRLLKDLVKRRDATTLSADMLLLKIRELLRDKKYDEAAAACETILTHPEATDAHKAQALWWGGAIHSEQRRNFPAAEKWVALAERYPKDANAPAAAANAVSSYQAVLQDPAKAEAHLADKRKGGFVDKYTHALEVLVDTHGNRDPKYRYELGVCYDLLGRYDDAIRCFGLVPDTHRLYMPSRYRILQQRYNKLQEQRQEDWIQRRRTATALVADLGDFRDRAARFAESSTDKQLAASVRKWGAECGLMIVRIYKDVLGDLAEALRQAERVLKEQKEFPDIVREARMLVMTIKLEQNKVDEVIAELEQSIQQGDVPGAEKVLVKIVPDLRVRVERLIHATDKKSADTLAQLLPQYSLFASRLYDFAVKSGFKGEQLVPVQEAKAHSLSLGFGAKAAADRKKAEQQAGEALALYASLSKARPNYGPYIRGLARCHRTLGNTKEAMELYDRLIEGLPEKSPEWWRMQLERLQFYMELLDAEKDAQRRAKSLDQALLYIKLLGYKDPNWGGLKPQFNEIEVEIRRMLQEIPQTQPADEPE